MENIIKDYIKNHNYKNFTDFVTKICDDYNFIYHYIDKYTNTDDIKNKIYINHIYRNFIIKYEEYYKDDYHVIFDKEFMLLIIVNKNTNIMNVFLVNELQNSSPFVILLYGINVIGIDYESIEIINNTPILYNNKINDVYIHFIKNNKIYKNNELYSDTNQVNVLKNKTTVYVDDNNKGHVVYIQNDIEERITFDNVKNIEVFYFDIDKMLLSVFYRNDTVELYKVPNNNYDFMLKLQNVSNITKHSNIIKINKNGKYSFYDGINLEPVILDTIEYNNCQYLFKSKKDKSYILSKIDGSKDILRNGEIILKDNNYIYTKDEKDKIFITEDNKGCHLYKNYDKIDFEMNLDFLNKYAELLIESRV